MKKTVYGSCYKSSLHRRYTSIKEFLDYSYFCSSSCRQIPTTLALECNNMVLFHFFVPNDVKPKLLEHLNTVNLSHNLLTSLTSEFFLLKEIANLDLSYNKFETIPEGISNLLLLEVHNRPLMDH